MSKITVSNITNRTGTSGPVIIGITSCVNTTCVELPKGSNAERVGIESGSLRYNNTAKLLEFYDGTEWRFILPANETANATGIFGGNSIIDSIVISSLGDSIIFSNEVRSLDNYMSAASSTTRGVVAGGGGFGSGKTSNISYITISSKGNPIFFGNLTSSKGGAGGCSSNTRGVFAGGDTGATPASTAVNTIDYITIATESNATAWGNILTQSRYYLSGCSSTTRGVFGSGASSSENKTNTLDYVTIASNGVAAIDFGDLTEIRGYSSTFCSSSTRGLFAGGYYQPTSVSARIDAITIATTGNAFTFGSLIRGRSSNSGCSSKTRGVFIGGYSFVPKFIYYNILDYVTIATTGDAQYFGSITGSDYPAGLASLSNDHGGLS